MTDPVGFSKMCYAPAPYSAVPANPDPEKLAKKLPNYDQHPTLSGCTIRNEDKLLCQVGAKVIGTFELGREVLGDETTPTFEDALRDFEEATGWSKPAIKRYNADRVRLILEGGMIMPVLTAENACDLLRPYFTTTDRYVSR